MTNSPETQQRSRGSVWVRALLREVEHSGSGSALFWGLFWSFFPHLTDDEIERTVHAAGSRGAGHWEAIAAAMESRRRTNPTQ